MDLERIDPGSSGGGLLSSSRRPVSRRWLKFLLEAMVSLAVLVAAEGVFEVFGLFSPPSLFRVSEDGRTVGGNPNWRPLWKTQKGYAERATFLAEKAPGTFRVFCTGASEAFGLPFKNYASFPTRLGEMLAERLPQIPIEVVNAAVGGTSSLETIEIVEEAIRHDADALVLLVGNNEFLWPYVLHTLKKIERPLVWHLDRFRERFHLCRLFGHMSWSVDSPLLEEFKHMDEFKQTNRIADRPWDGGRLSRDIVFGQLTERLNRVCDMAKNLNPDKAIPVVFCVPTCSRTEAPRYSMYSPSTTPEQKEEWRKSFYKGARQLEAGNVKIALKRLQQAEAIDPNPAILQYHLGQALYQLGEYEASKPKFERSMEADGFPQRATKRLRETVRACAKANSVILVDLDEKFLESAGELPLDITAHLLMDGTHMSPTGNRFVARLVANALADANIPVPLSEWKPDRPFSEEELRFDEELAEENRDWKKKSKQERDAILRLGQALIELAAAGNDGPAEPVYEDYRNTCDALARDYPAFPHARVGRAILAAWQKKPDLARRLAAEAKPMKEAIDLFHKAMKNVPEMTDPIEEAGLIEEANRLMAEEALISE